MSSGQPLNASPSEGSSCNGVSLAFVLAAAVFGVLGYRYTSTYGYLAAVVGSIGGIVVGVVATPVVFVVLMVFIHVGVRIEDWFRKPPV